MDYSKLKEKLLDFTWDCSINGKNYYKIYNSFTKEEMQYLLKKFGLTFKPKGD